MKIDEYVPDAIPTSSAKAKSLQRLAAEQQQREHGQQRAERCGQRSRQHLAHRAVDDLREGGPRHARHVLAHAVEHDDRVVEGVAQDGEQRRDRRRRHLPAGQRVHAAVISRSCISAMSTGTAYFHSKRSAMYSADDEQRRDDRDHRALRHGLAERRPDRVVGEVVADAVSLVESRADVLAPCPAPGSAWRSGKRCFPGSCCETFWILASA